MAAEQLKFLGQAPVNDGGATLAVTLVTANVGGGGVYASETVTWAVAVVLPASLVAVMVYVVVAAGETSVVPEEAKVPNPGLIATDVAFDTLQLKVAELPTVMPGGLAVKELITGRLTGSGGDTVSETITCVVAATLPAALVAVRV
jgi:hypothetical protein